MIAVVMSGIFNIKSNRVQVVLEGTQNMAVPLIHNGVLMVDRQYVETCIQLANVKMQRNDDLWRKFSSCFNVVYHVSQ